MWRMWQQRAPTVLQGRRHAGAQALMPYEGRDALDLVRHPVRRNLEVDFFGGEPLMNWDVVKRL